MDIVPCTAIHPLQDGRVHLLGAVDQVTGAMTRVETGGKALLVDCGIAQGRDARAWQFPDAARDVDGVLLTHGHLDHIGSLPALLDGGFDRPIVGTKPTLDIARISLEDSLEMQRLPDAAVRGFLKRFDQLARSVPYGVGGGSAFDFPGTITFREAGHILGSASVEIVSAKSRVIVSGDLGRPDSPILMDYNTTWDAGRPVDVVVMEATYGARDHEHSHDDVEQQLKRIVQQAARDKSKVLVPSFAIGRTQTLLWFLNRLVERGDVVNVPVALDTPMGLVVTETYDRFHKLFDKQSLDALGRGDDPLDFEELFSVKRGRDSARLREVPGPLIIIAGSGMCTGGRIVGHLLDGLPDPRTVVCFVGHQAQGTPGRRIQEAAKTGGVVRLDGMDVPVRARIETLRGLSAHADRSELKRWLGAIPGVRRCALHHGEAEAQRAFATWAHMSA
jgi:metallo-beta-lactamase family protein